MTFTAIERHFAGDSGVGMEDSQATFGEDIALTGFEICQIGDDTLEVALRWLALRRMDQSYKVFLHLIGTTTGEIVSQVDTAPRNWGYPTMWWEQDELVGNSLQLALGRVVQGEYDLFIGLHNEATGKRLLVTQHQDMPEPQDSFLLARIQH